MSAKIPQNVTIEDKLVGPLTLKQFLYILAAAAIVFIAYQYYIRLYLYFIEFVFISFIVTTLSLMLAFGKVNGRPFGIFLINWIKFLFSKKTRSWKKEPREFVKDIKVRAKDIKSTKEELKERQSNQEFKTQIEKLATILDTGGRISENDADAITNQISNITEAPSKTEPEQNLGVEDILEDTE